MDKMNHIISFWHSVSQQTIKAAPQIAIGVFIFIVAWIIAVIVKSCIVRLAKRSQNRLFLYRLLGSLVMMLILFTGLIIALGTMGVNVGALIASLGVVGFAVGFALKDTLSNIMAGFLVLFYQPFKSGDYILVEKVEGKVVDVNLRYTVINTTTEHIFVPNSVILANPLTVKEQ